MELTPEEFEEFVESAVDEALEKAWEDKVTAPGLMIMLTKWHVNTPEGRQRAFKMMKERGKKVYSNEGFGGSGRLANKG